MSARFTGTCEPLCAVEIDDLVAWVSQIPFTDWPQQHPVDDGVRPAMVNECGWHGMGSRTNLLVAELLEHFRGCTDQNRMLSVVMPGHGIVGHRDLQGPRWVTRLHIPLLTNPDAHLYYEGEDHWLEPGVCYQVNTERWHRIDNAGAEPRVHFMVDVHEVR